MVLQRVDEISYRADGRPLVGLGVKSQERDRSPPVQMANGIEVCDKIRRIPPGVVHLRVVTDSRFHACTLEIMVIAQAAERRHATSRHAADRHSIEIEDAFVFRRRQGFDDLIDFLQRLLDDMKSGVCSLH